MVQYYPENTLDSFDLVDSARYHQHHLYAKQSQHHRPVTRRRRSISKPPYRQQHSSSPVFPPTTSQQQYSWFYYEDEPDDIYELPRSYWEPYETMPDDLMLDDNDDDMDATPGQHWSSFATRLSPPQRTRSLAYHHQPDNYYAWHDDDDDHYFYNENDQRMTRRSSSKGYHYPNDRYYIDLRRRRSLGPPPQHRSRDYGNYSDTEEDDVPRHVQYQEKPQPRRRHSIQQQQQQQHDDDGHRHHHQQYKTPSAPWIHSPVMGSPEPTCSPHPFSVLHPPRHARMEQAPPLLSIDTQQQQHLAPTTTSFYGQVPPSILPMPQPMIPPPPSSFLPHQHFNYGFPTIPPTIMPVPFNPMMMPQQQPHHYLQEKLPITSASASTTVSSPTMTAPAPAPPSLDDAKSPSSAPDLTTTTSPVNASAPSSSTSAKGENALIPLARSLSLGTSQPLRTNPRRRRSLFESLFGSPSTPTTTTTTASTSTATDKHQPGSPSLIPVQALTRNSLTRKQSISLEKKAKALSQRSYIWCYRIKPSFMMPSSQANGGGGSDTAAWIAMVPRNQSKMDPYLVYYQPGAVIKGLLGTASLPTLVTLDKEPKLTGSITVMPQAKIARVYPSMFSSSNYLELIIDCLPADSQFVVRSD